MAATRTVGWPGGDRQDQWPGGGVETERARWRQQQGHGRVSGDRQNQLARRWQKWSGPGGGRDENDGGLGGGREDSSGQARWR